ncbi:NYN domain-containing protein [Pectobacterium brasiliense]|uniref:NYN domain-containing protein n=1 Tax=Pectobacterium brasiliense TaxID=180957 RepID=UPI0030CE9565
MKDLESAKKIAVLIDAENAQSSVMGAVLAELTKHGHIIVKRAYGDWSSSHLKNWKQPLNELAITPFQQFSYTQGKNSSDAAMIIDAMDLLYSNKFDAFALISSDSDFTKLASRLKESQIYVFGVGEKKTPVAFRNACDDFIFIEVLKNLSIDPDENKDEGKSENTDPIKKSKKELRSDTHLMRILKNSINEYTEEDGWAPLASCGSLIKRQHPDFDARNYGYSSLTKLIESIELFDIDRRKSNKEIVSHDVVYIKNKRS